MKNFRNKKYIIFICFFYLIISMLVVNVTVNAEQADMTIGIKQVFVSVYGASPSYNKKIDYVLTPEKEIYPMPNNKVGGEYKFSIMGSTIKKIGPIEYKTPGLYRYTIKSLEVDDKDYEYSKTVYSVVVCVYEKDGKFATEIIVYNSKMEKASVLAYEHKVISKPDPTVRPTTPPNATKSPAPTKGVVDPDTGDRSQLGLNWSIVIISALLLGFMLFYEKKRKKERKL